MNFDFTITKDVAELGVKGIYFLITGMKNSIENRTFEIFKKAEIDKLKYNLSLVTTESNENLLGFRKLHDLVGRSNKTYVSSPENLLNYFLKNGDIPKINLIVDIYNLVSLKYLLALGAHDLGKIDGSVTLKLIKGDEKFIPLGQTLPKPIFAGDYCYVDDSNEIICYLETRQVEKTKITDATTEAFYIVQGNLNTKESYIKRAAFEVIDLTKRFCGGEEDILYI